VKQPVASHGCGSKLQAADQAQAQARSTSCRRKPASTTFHRQHPAKKKKSKRFFFEKKKQKTFIYCGLLHAPANVPKDQKLFASPPARLFFKKEALASLP
jgi:hypothetical protein